MSPEKISILAYTYHLPEEKIAFYPLAERDQSRLLISNSGQITEDVYSNIHNHFSPGSLLVFNNTRVVEARLIFQKPSGGNIEIFCLEPADIDRSIEAGMSATGSVQWNCLIGGASKWKAGQILEKNLGDVTLSASYIEKKKDSFVIQFKWNQADLSFAQILHLAGQIPLPPYIKRAPEKRDEERYQTTFAKHDGSVAAPTAGLHFTERVFDNLKKQNIDTAFLTLHVGAGTFQPVKADTMEQHTMHAESFEVSTTTIRQLLTSSGKVYAVGTTSARTLESIYWIGLQILQNPETAVFELGQWDAYHTQTAPAPDEVLMNLLKWMEENHTDTITGRTRILIAPGYQFKIVNGLITNFHQPQSTLLLLVAALIGEHWHNVYDYALNNNFRFLSYGDGCLLIP
ncbi:MAG: S-adenosylmethionine:tRNA ribosyltransferase-isomerase [Gemmatimonadaceae bacterium]|nr:S-adenosylmethionine:tRNA ribosyltransferase-isomerase [Chitinophagaceae bacterium]